MTRFLTAISFGMGLTVGLTIAFIAKSTYISQGAFYKELRDKSIQSESSKKMLIERIEKDFYLYKEYKEYKEYKGKK